MDAIDAIAVFDRNGGYGESRQRQPGVLASRVQEAAVHKIRSRDATALVVMRPLMARWTTKPAAPAESIRHLLCGC